MLVTRRYLEDKGAEPEIRLSNGAFVLRCIYDNVTELLASNHSIKVTDAGVFVDPLVHFNCWVCLDTNARDVVAILDHHRSGGDLAEPRTPTT